MKKMKLSVQLDFIVHPPMALSKCAAASHRDSLSRACLDTRGTHPWDSHPFCVILMGLKIP